MNRLDAIPIQVEDVGLPHRTENLQPLMQQVEQALHELVEHGAETVIDLSSMPFSEQDEKDLRARLGAGEVNASVMAFGPTLVQESAFPGVWLVEHQNAEQRRLTLQLVVARVPEILMTPPDDLPDSLAALRRANAESFDTPGKDVR
jgi:hydrogenase-1 operon protein HyaF